MPVKLTGLGGPGATITLDAPARLNAFGRQDLRDLGDALDRCAADPEIACVVLRGSGRAFCAGADLALIDEIRRAPAAERRASLALTPSVMLQIAQFPKPTIAAVQGAAFGGGVCIALACDDVVLAEDARLGFIFTSLGLPGGDSAATWLLSRRIGTRQAWQLLSHGAIVGAQEAAAAGLADAVVPLNRLSEEVAARTADYCRRSATALAATKQQLLRLDGVGSFLEPAMDRELAAMLAAFDGPDLAEGLAAHHQKREPRWPSRVTAAGLADGSERSDTAGSGSAQSPGESG
jgi:enoyl-CoA hydratase/carnithine racemase